MKLLNQKLQELRKTGRLGFMAHVVVGYPLLEDTIKIVRQMEKSGVDIVELQIPFSDPLADGPTIMRACEESLRNGTKVSDAFSIMKRLSKEVSTPLLFMAYYNNVFRYGVEKFCRDAHDAGCEGLIVPDVPLDEEENEHFIASLAKSDLANIRVVSPSSTKERLQKNAAVGTGFVYAAARQGITGAKETLNSELRTYLERIRKVFTIPIAVGFGISKKEHLQALKGHADIAIVGSALIDVINSAGQNIERNVADFIQELKMID